MLDLLISNADRFCKKGRKSVLVTQFRSGSHLLSDLLALALPDDRDCHIFFHVHDVLWLLHPELKKVIPSYKFVYLDRKDKFLQAMSYYFMRSRISQIERTEKNAANIDDRVSTKTANDSDSFHYTYDFKKILQSYNQIIEQSLLGDTFFSILRIRPLRVYYEELIIDTTAVVRKICDFVGGEPDRFPSLEDSQFQRMFLPETESFVKRFKEDLERHIDKESVETFKQMLSEAKNEKRTHYGRL